MGASNKCFILISKIKVLTDMKLDINLNYFHIVITLILHNSIPQINKCTCCEN